MYPLYPATTEPPSIHIGKRNIIQQHRVLVRHLSMGPPEGPEWSLRRTSCVESSKHLFHRSCESSPLPKQNPKPLQTHESVWRFFIYTYPMIPSSFIGLKSATINHQVIYSMCQIALTRQSIQSQHVTLFTCTICQVGQHVQHYIFHCPFRIWALGALSQHRHDTRATRKTTLRRGLLLRESIIPKLVAELFTILSEGSYYLLQPCHLCRVDHCAFGCEHHGT